tara:strand:- start:233 stop:388 length:156 start_codon:yes stop_codon:yes gene_type:complete
MLKRKNTLNKGSFFKTMHEENKKEMLKKYKNSTKAKQKAKTATDKNKKGGK